MRSAGAGVNSEWHDKKYGTLLVNLLIQAYKLIFPVAEHHKIRVYGETHCDLREDDPLVLEDCKRRSHFWGRFGLNVESPEMRKSPMSCTLADLNIVERDIYPGLKTSLPLDNFRLEIHTPIFLEDDIQKLHKLDIHDYDVKRVMKSRAEVNSHSKTMYKEFRFATCFVSAIFSYGLIQLTPSDQLLVVKTISFFLFVFIGYFIGLQFTPTSWLRFMPAAISVRKAERDKQDALEYLSSKLTVLLNGDNRFIDRLYRALKDQLDGFPKDQSLSHVIYSMDGGKIDDHDSPAVASIVLYIEKSIKELNQLKSTEHVTKGDFLFGDVSSMSVNDLNYYNGRLGQQFGHHINRLLSLRDGNHLTIYGTPDKSIDEVWLTLRDQIAYIVLYACDLSDGNKRVGVKVYLQDGLLDISRVWCTRKEEYFTYAMRALSPLLTVKDSAGHLLISKTYVSWSSSSFDKPAAASQILVEFAAEVSDLSGSRFSDQEIESCTMGIQKRLIGNTPATEEYSL